MSLFNTRRSVRALSDEALESIKQRLESMLSIAASLDVAMGKTDSFVISLEGRMRGDLLAFMLYLDGVDKNTDPADIAVVNRLFDTNLTQTDFAMFRQEVANKWFEQAVPPSFLILKELGKTLQTEQETAPDGRTALEVSQQSGVQDIALELGNGLIDLYALVGSAFLSADGNITKRESNDLIRYLAMLNRSVNGVDAPFPPGAAQRAYDAHIRLFGRKPRL